MLRLFVLRHAKSSWADPGKSDFDRTLNSRGAGDLPATAAILREYADLPEQIFCSPARRARLTLDGVLAAFKAPPRIDYVAELYSGDVSAYFNCLRKHEGPGPIMIVGHNPMCHGVALMLAGDGEPEALAALAGKFPTSGLAVLEFAGASWSQARRHSGFLRAFHFPKAR